MDSFKTLQDEISKALVSTTRSASHISRADITFQRSLNPQVGEQLDAQNARLLHLAQRLLQNAATSSDAVGPKLPDVESIDANWRGVVDVIDSLLEKADISLDEYTGVVKRLSPAGEQVQPAPMSHVEPSANITTGCCNSTSKHRREEDDRKATAAIRAHTKEQRDWWIPPVGDIETTCKDPTGRMLEDIQRQERTGAVRRTAN
jgi:hypothetical protein